MVELLGADVPVYAGCPYPLVHDLLPGRRRNADEEPKETVVDGKVVAVHEKTLPAAPRRSTP